jgi:hypothetical protein
VSHGRNDTVRLRELHATSIRGLCAGHDAPGVIDGWVYERFGFPEVGRSSVRRGDVAVPVVLMERP